MGVKLLLSNWERNMGASVQEYVSGEFWGPIRDETMGGVKNAQRIAL
jgi:hypothetical protein